MKGWGCVSDKRSLEVLISKVLRFVSRTEGRGVGGVRCPCVVEKVPECNVSLILRLRREPNIPEHLELVDLAEDSGGNK